MSGQWYFSHDGATHGQFSSDEIKEHASPAPDWLSDVAKVESKGPSPIPAVIQESPEWLEDLRLWIGLELVVAAKTGHETAASGLQPGGMPDWLEGWLTPDEPKVSASTATASSPTAVSQKAIIPAGALPPKQVAAPPLRSSPAPKPTVPLPTPRVISPATYLEKAGAIPAPPAQALVVQLPEKARPTRRPEDILAEKAIEQTGFDQKSGQILDPEKFRKWQRSCHAQQPAVSNESAFEVFRKARIAIENWVDEDSRQALVMAGDIAAIKQDAGLLEVVRRYEGLGAAFQEKIMHHLEFMVDNRRKYYHACSQRART